MPVHHCSSCHCSPHPSPQLAVMNASSCTALQHSTKHLQQSCICAYIRQSPQHVCSSSTELPGVEPLELSIPVSHGCHVAATCYISDSPRHVIVGVMLHVTPCSACPSRRTPPISKLLTENNGSLVCWTSFYQPDSSSNNFETLGQLVVSVLAMMDTVQTLRLALKQQT